MLLDMYHMGNLQVFLHISIYALRDLRKLRESACSNKHMGDLRKLQGF